MKMDPEYIRKLLLAAESVPSPNPNLNEISNAFFEDPSPKLNHDDNFIFHYELLLDYGFIKPLSDHTGITRMLDGSIVVSPIEVRITAKGHEFITAMEKSDVWEVIKKDFKNESLQTISAVAKELALGFAKQKLEKYLDK